MAKKRGEEASEQAREVYKVTPEEFIRAWQTSESADAVAKKLNMPKPIVHARASNYRMAGIKLKKMPRRPKNLLDVDKLNKLIDKINRETGE